MQPPALRTVCAVIGTTGAGKSQLAVALAKAFSGQIINGDAMQVYRGLDILTNKQPLEERQGVPHHLLGYLNISKNFSVLEFEKEALRVIDQLHETGTLPILIGGTHYYTQAVLFKNALLSQTSGKKEEKISYDAVEQEEKYSETTINNNNISLPHLDCLFNLSTADLYAYLKAIDPVIASRWHPHDRRRIQRCLEIYHETGRLPSELYKEQHQNNGRREILRFRTCIFWVYRHYESLDQILDKRVDQMCNSGLFDEIRIMYDEWKALKERKISLDMQKGIWQAIGFKEFLPYLQLPENTTEQVRMAYLSSAIDSMKLATRQYARKQIRWIRNKLYPLCKASGPDVQFYLLDASDPSHWDTHVQDLAITLATDFLQGRPGPDPLSLNAAAATLLSQKLTPDYASQTELWKQYICDVCKTSSGAPLVAIGLPQWIIHVQGRRHRKMLSKHQTEIRNQAIKGTSSDPSPTSVTQKL